MISKSEQKRRAFSTHARTAEEFEMVYATRSGLTVAALRAAGRVVRPCACGDPICEGWQSLNAEAAREYDARHTPC